METKKVLITALMVMLFAGLANAAVDITINLPTAGQTYYPNIIDGVDYIDVNITFVDSTATNAHHELGLTFKVGDVNYNMTGDENAVTIGTDMNLSSANCVFAVQDVWTTPGATCLIRYLIPTNPQIPTGNYILDVNGTAYSADGHLEGTETELVAFGLDNRFVSTSVETLLNLLPVILIAAMVVGVILLGLGAISGKTFLVITVGAIVSIISVVVLSGILGILTP